MLILWRKPGSQVQSGTDALRWGWPGGSPPASTSPDLPAAAIAWLRADPDLVAAFGENTAAKATTKFHAAVARTGVQLPWAVYDEVDGDIQYMTAGPDGVRNTIETGAIRFAVVADSKRDARDLGRMLTNRLDDAPLVFDDGHLMYIRAKQPFFAPVDSVLPGSTTGFARVILFETMLNRQV